MARAINLNALVSQVLSQSRQLVCRLCFGDMLQGHLGLEDEVIIEKQHHTYCPEFTTLQDMLVSITQSAIDADPSRPNALCLTCANYTINAFIFQKFSQHSNAKWLQVQISIAESLGDGPLHSEESKALFIILDDAQPKTFTDKTVIKTKKHALRKAKSILDKSYKRNKTAFTHKFQCRHCGQLFVKEHLLNRHMVIHDRNLECRVCSKSFLSKFKYKVHMERFHAAKTFQCSECPKLFGSEFLVEEHKKALHVRGACSICGKEYNARKALKDHEDSHKIEWWCVPCGKHYKYKECLKVHMKHCKVLNDNAKRQYQCNDCGKSYTFKHTLQLHIQFAHSETPISCEVCSKKFLTQNALKNHMSVHTGVKNFKCEHCGGTFMSSSTLVYHIRAKHTGVKPYKCEDCEESFITSFRRLEHMRKWHGAPAPQCHVCQRKFTTKPSLTKHMKKHDKYEFVDYLEPRENRWYESLNMMLNEKI